MPPLRPAMIESGSKGGSAVLYLHGNAGNRAVAHRVRLYKTLQQLGYRVYAFDYRGFGDSKGAEIGARFTTPTEASLHEDAVAMWRYVRKKHDAKEVLIWGHSLGSAVTVNLLQVGAIPTRLYARSPLSSPSLLDTGGGVGIPCRCGARSAADFGCSSSGRHTPAPRTVSRPTHRGDSGCLVRSLR